MMRHSKIYERVLGLQEEGKIHFFRVSKLTFCEIARVRAKFQQQQKVDILRLKLKF